MTDPPAVGPGRHPIDLQPPGDCPHADTGQGTVTSGTAFDICARGHSARLIAVMRRSEWRPWRPIPAG